MSGDLFTDPALAPSRRINYGFAGSSLGGAQYGGSITLVPRDPEMQRLVDAMNAEEDAERVRKEIEMDTPENCQKAAEAELAERERKRINFHFCRAMSTHITEGWKQIMDDRKDEEIRVYTTDYSQLRFWGIKPAGVGMYDFWEQNDPEISRYDDNIAMTWANPLVPPPITAYDENIPVIWAGQGSNPDVVAPELPAAEVPPPAKAAAKPRRRQKPAEVHSTHRVRKSTTESPKGNKNTRKSLADKMPETMSRESLVEWADGTTKKVTFSNYGDFSDTAPANPTMQRIAAEIKAQKEAEMNTPENRRKAAEAESAERAQKKHNFHYGRALPTQVMEGWELIGGNRTNEEIRVYTRTYDWKHRFWGIKPIGMTMDDFWERHDPEVARHHDAQQECPLDPEKPLGPLIGEPIEDLPPPIGSAAKPRRRQKTPEVNTSHRVRKSTTESPKVNKKNRNSFADEVGVESSGLKDQVRGAPVAIHANGRPTRNKTNVIAPDAEPKSVTEDGGSAPPKRSRGRPVTKTKSAANDSKRPRGRPPTKGKQAGKPPKQKKTPTVKGNARVTKSKQIKPRPSAPSTHKMRSRGEGPAELLRLP